MTAQFKVIKVDPEGSGMDYVGHLNANIYNAKRCCHNCTVIFGSFVDGLCHDPNKPESADNDPRPVGPFVYGELEPLNEEAQQIMKEIEEEHSDTIEYYKNKNLLNKAATILRANLSKEEMVQLGNALDGGAGDLLLDEVNEILQEIAPEVFGEVEEKV